MALTLNHQQSIKPGIKIKVVCRVRPFLPGEEVDNSVEVNHLEKSLKVINQRNPAEVLKYTFDNCYDAQASQQTIFKENVLSLLNEVFRGLDATVFCYGMTGAGKTHTIQGTAEHPGLIPQSLAAIFQRRTEFINEAKPGVTNKFEVQVSYMEIYKENVYDLLKPRDPAMKEGLTVREDATRNVIVAGLEKKKIDSLAQFEHEFTKACKNRATAATMLNQQSSRSHAILGVDVRIEDGDLKKVFRGKLNLIDLAGSEDNRRTGNDAKRLDESKAINTSLLVLGKVVDAINSRATRIPYRDSKMTRILQPSLGGKSLGMMFVNIAPAKKFFQETYQALNFATKSKEIVNNAVANETKEVHKVRSVSLQSLTSKRPLSRPPSRCGPLPRNQSNAEAPNYRELASRLSDATKKSNAEALIRYAKRRVEEGGVRDALISYKQAQEFAPDDPELEANVRRLEAQLANGQGPPPKLLKAGLSPKVELKTKVIASALASPPRTTRRASSIPPVVPGVPPHETTTPSKCLRRPPGLVDLTLPENDSANTSKTESSELFQTPITSTRPRRHPVRQARLISQTATTKTKCAPALQEEANVRAALTDPHHPLLALFRMGKPDMLRGIWPAGNKIRPAVAEYVKAHGLKVLMDLVPNPISERVLLKAIRKFNADDV